MKWLYYLRSIFGAAIYPFFLLIMSSLTVLQNLFFANRSYDDACVRFWGHWSCKIFGVSVKVTGLENYPEGGGIFLFNHTSFFDIFAMAACLPGIRFGAKIELFKIPVFGYAMNRIGILPIARESRNEVIKIYQGALERIRRGEKVALAPEGTRQEIEKLGNFKSGPFIFAINAQAPLVPVVIRGAAAILPKGAIFPTWGVSGCQIELLILPATSTNGLSVEARHEVQQKLRNQMLPYFQSSEKSAQA